jgi:quercetin dioxygenase-like cupin family protein
VRRRFAKTLSKIFFLNHGKSQNRTTAIDKTDAFLQFILIIIRMKIFVICCMIGLCPVLTAQNAKNGKASGRGAFLTVVENGAVFYVDREEIISGKGWNAHASYRGIYLKHLVPGADTENRLSCHIVKVDPDCVLEEHIHDGKLELHEVIAGSGTCFLNGKAISYQPGIISVIPANTKHKVAAGKDGLYLLAKFTPALL